MEPAGRTSVFCTPRSKLLEPSGYVQSRRRRRQSYVIVRSWRRGAVGRLGGGTAKMIGRGRAAAQRSRSRHTDRRDGVSGSCAGACKTGLGACAERVCHDGKPRACERCRDSRSAASVSRSRHGSNACVGRVATDGHPGLARSMDCAAQWLQGGPKHDPDTPGTDIECHGNLDCGCMHLYTVSQRLRYWMDARTWILNNYRHGVEVSCREVVG